jgi:HD superfamily phosphohydrolase
MSIIRQPLDALLSDSESEDDVICSPFATEATLGDFKIINDPIHGHIHVDRDVVRAIDTPEFQRLRDLKQLGTAYFVFPGASHNRFEHSIGVSHLADRMVTRFRETQPELEISEMDAKCVKIAGLCHDLGHGPFSHVFDNEFLPRARPNLGWAHEEGSLMMFQHMVDSNHLDYEPGDIRRIKNMIVSGQPAGAPRREKDYLYQIVANYNNSVDVDKFDYLARDCHNLGLKSSYDFSRLLFSCRVVNDEICYHAKEVYNLYEMFHTRYSLHKQIYSHRVVKAIEYMICDVLLLADRHLGFSECVRDPSRFLGLTDCILKDIEFSKDPALRPAQELLSRLRRRDLYKFVDEIIVPPELVAEFPKITEQEISTHQGIGNVLRPEDLLVQNLRIDYAMKERNPVDHIHFYADPQTTNKSFLIPKHKVSSLIPEQFQERYVRLYCRDPAKRVAAQQAFHNFIRKYKLQGTKGKLQEYLTTPTKMQRAKKRRIEDVEREDE